MIQHEKIKQKDSSNNRILTKTNKILTITNKIKQNQIKQNQTNSKIKTSITTSNHHNGYKFQSFKWFHHGTWSQRRSSTPAEKLLLYTSNSKTFVVSTISSSTSSIEPTQPQKDKELHSASRPILYPLLDILGRSCTSSRNLWMSLLF